MEFFKEFMKRKHICSTPGCRNRDTVRIARTAGARTALFLCRDCISQAFAGALGVDTTGCRDLDDVACAVAYEIGEREGLERKGDAHGGK